MDAKIKRLLQKHGMEGYGIYWSIVEELYINANALHSDSDGIAYDLRCDVKVVESVLYDFDLFDTLCDGSIYSPGIDKRISEIKEKSKKARESALYRWHNKVEKSDDDANAMRTQCDGNAIKEKKRKEIKENKEYVVFDEFPKVKLTLTEYDKLCKELGTVRAKDMVERLGLYIGSKGDKYKNHYMTIKNWIRMDKDKNAQQPTFTPKLQRI